VRDSSLATADDLARIYTEEFGAIRDEILRRVAADDAHSGTGVPLKTKGTEEWD